MSKNIGIEFLVKQFTAEELAMQNLALTRENQELIKLLDQYQLNQKKEGIKHGIKL